MAMEATAKIKVEGEKAIADAKKVGAAVEGIGTSAQKAASHLKTLVTIELAKLAKEAYNVAKDVGEKLYEAGAKQQKTLDDLSAAMRQNGEDFEAQKESLETWTQQMGKLMGVEDESILKALTGQERLGKGIEEAKRNVKGISDVAGRFHLSMAEAESLVEAAQQNRTRGLKQYGIQWEATKDAAVNSERAVAALFKAAEGGTESQLKNDPAKELTASMENLKVELAKGAFPAIRDQILAINDAISKMDPGQVKAIGESIGIVFTAAGNAALFLAKGIAGVAAGIDYLSKAKKGSEIEREIVEHRDHANDLDALSKLHRQKAQSLTDQAHAAPEGSAEQQALYKEATRLNRSAAMNDEVAGRERSQIGALAKKQQDVMDSFDSSAWSKTMGTFDTAMGAGQSNRSASAGAAREAQTKALAGGAPSTVPAKGVIMTEAAKQRADAAKLQQKRAEMSRKAMQKLNKGGGVTTVRFVSNEPSHSIVAN